MKNRRRIFLTAVLVLAVILALWQTFNLPEQNRELISEAEIKQATNTTADVLTEKTEDFETAPDENGHGQNEASDDAERPASSENIPFTPEPAQAQTESDVSENEEFTCTLSVRCDTVLNNLPLLKDGKEEIVPANGVIFAPQTVKFNDGETVFNLLVREMKLNKIHLEFTNTPIYNSAYIEGIGNLYEFDCGELSGWMYRVNGVFPNYSCSEYKLKKGDKVEWVYSCDLGKDVGGHYSAGNSRKYETQ